MRREVVRTVSRAWENYYHLGEDRDLAFELALLAYDYEGFEAALGLFQASRKLHGDDPRTWWNMGLCHFALGETAEALQCFEEAARLRPGFTPRSPALPKP
jgi:tetratricopeptide (TPR) repeat protein